MCMRASGASELRKFWHFYILKLLFLSIFCRYIENKPWLNFIWRGKRPPPPTSTPVTIIAATIGVRDHFRLGGGGAQQFLPEKSNMFGQCIFASHGGGGGVRRAALFE